MKTLMSIVVLMLVVVACSEPAKGVTQPPRAVTNDTWSDSVISVSPQDLGALTVIHGATVDASGAPLAGVLVALDSRMAPADPGYASSHAIRRIGTLTSDANGHFAITSTPRGYYQLGAELNGATHSSGGATVDLRSGGSEVDVTIHLAATQ